MMAMVEKAETGMDEITHQEISKEEVHLETGSSKTDGQTKYGWPNAGY